MHLIKPSKNSNIIESIQILRGVAVLMVLIYHMGVYENKSCSDSILGQLAEVGSAGVDIFFTISGFVMITISNRMNDKDINPLKFLLRRAIRIYPLYWLYTVIVIFIFLVQPNLANRSGGIADTSILKSIFLMPENGAPLVGQGWTLIHEMYFYIVFSLMLFVSSCKRKYLIFCWALVISAYVYMIPFSWISADFSANPWIRLIFNPLTLEFLGGCLIANISTVNRKYWARLILFTGTCLMITLRDWLGEENNFGREFYYGIPSLLIVYGAVSLEKNGLFPKLFTLKRIGDASYSIYLSHILCLSCCLIIWRLFKQEGHFDNIAILVTMAMASIFTGLLSYRWIEQPMINFGQNFLKKRGL